jgi:bifunctional NMN adenylyltransferase/nudix hydrolase
MVEEHYEDLSAILPLYDQRSNEIWSQVLDSKIREIFQIGSVVLYGSKDSFIPYYTGSFHTCELVPDNFVSATDVRAEVSNKILKSKEFRAGIIYGTYNSHPNVYPTVDVAITNEDQTKVLLGRKKNEVEFRFIGGFVDPDDESLKATVRRESSEETNLEVGNITYLESFKVKDWRYENEIDKSIMTHFFIAKKIFGTEKAGDDIVEVKWFDIDKIKDSDLVGEHIKLYHELTNYLTRYEK